MAEHTLVTNRSLKAPRGFNGINRERVVLFAVGFGLLAQQISNGPGASPSKAQTENRAGRKELFTALLAGVMKAGAFVGVSRF